jgi:protein-L-isoaspartate(D-aspartate) O-methyltransferase
MDERAVAALVLVFFLVSSVYVIQRFGLRDVVVQRTADVAAPVFGDEPEDKALRSNMVSEISAMNITDAMVLEVMGALPRHLFLPSGLRGQAYSNFPLPIGFNRTTPQPYYVAYVVQAIRPNPKERVLEVGTGSGYQTAVLASLSGVVYSVEKEGTLAEDASKTLETLGIENAHVKEGDPLKGWPENAPYDVIIVNNAVSDIPYHLSAQLAEDGRMILPLRESDAYQRLTIVSRVSGKVETQPLIIVRFDQI